MARSLKSAKTRAVRAHGWDCPGFPWRARRARNGAGGPRRPPASRAWRSRAGAVRRPDHGSLRARVGRHAQRGRRAGAVAPVEGDGATLHACGLWTAQLVGAARSISPLELQAGYHALATWSAQLRGVTVLWQSDNSTVRHDVAKWKSRSPQLSAALRYLHTRVMELGVKLVSAHVPGETNRSTDWLRRWRDRSDWRLYPALFRAIQCLRRRCKVDEFDSRASAELPRFWTLF